MSVASRESDERLLTMLRLREAGWSPERIAARYGVTPSYVRSITTRIMRESA